MGLRNLTKNWSSALRRLLEPAGLVSAVTAGMRIILDRLGGFSHIPYTGCPVSVGESYKPVAVKLADIVKVGGVTADKSVTEAVAGAGDIRFRLRDLPTGIVVFAKSAADVDNVLHKGIDFVEKAPGVYEFYKNPADFGVISALDGGKCGWLCIIGKASSNKNQDINNFYKNNTLYRTNKALVRALKDVEMSCGVASTANYLSCNCDPPQRSNVKIVDKWTEGSDFYCISDENECIKLNSAQFFSISADSYLHDAYTSNTMLYMLDSVMHSVDIEDGGRIVKETNDSLDTLCGMPSSSIAKDELRALMYAKGFSTFDTTKFNSRSIAKTLNNALSNSPGVFNIQKIMLPASFRGADTICVHYSSDRTAEGLTEYNIAAWDKLCSAHIIDNGVEMTNDTRRWISSNGSVLGNHAEVGDSIVGVTAFINSPDTDTCDILGYMPVANSFIHPGNIIVLTTE